MRGREQYPANPNVQGTLMFYHNYGDYSVCYDILDFLKIIPNYI